METCKGNIFIVIYFLEAPLLGTVSRTRRAKSANARNLSSRSRRRLFNESETSSSDTVINIPCDKPSKSNNQLDYATERMRQIKESLKVQHTEAELGRMRPINIDVAMGNENLYADLISLDANKQNIFIFF